MPIEVYRNLNIEQYHAHRSLPCRGSMHQYVPQKIAAKGFRGDEKRGPAIASKGRRERNEETERNQYGALGGKKAIVDRTSKPLTIASLRQGKNLASSKRPFLWKLHEMLSDVEKTGNQHIVSWLDHGKAFRVHRPKSFVQKIVPFYFRQSKYKSFQRQLHLYEFTRTPRGPEAGAYSHPLFVRGGRSMCLSMKPIKIKGKIYKNHAVECASLGPVTTHDEEPQPQQMSSSASDCANEASQCDVNPGKKLPFALNSKMGMQLVTGASLAAELERKSLSGEMEPHSGDIVYIFGGMPFRYIDEPAEAPDTMDINTLGEREYEELLLTLV